MLISQALESAASRLATGFIAVALLMSAPLLGPGSSLAQAQAEVSVATEFRTALEPHGKWQRHNRWGEVWIPANRERGWRPYTVGQWAYTDDWGWYWTAADAEADWGWVVYHYGRWVLDDEHGWVWVPGNEWSPGWVNWRRGEQGDYFGWAPLPPDPVVVEYRDKPDAWIFVRARDFVAPVMARVIVPVAEYQTIIRRTVIVNRTVVIRDRRIAVNPGIAPAIIAARVGRPIRAFEIRPVVIAGTVRIANAVELRGDEVRRRDRIRVTVRETQRTIQATRDVPRPRALADNEQGRLGDNPPRAARQDDRRDAREERREDRRDAQQERRDDRRDAQKEQREDRRDAQKDRREDRRDAHKEGQRDDRRDAQKGRDAQKDGQREERRDAQKDRQREDRRDAQKDRREDRRDARKEGQRDDRRDAQKDGQRDDRRDAQKDRQREDRRDTKSGDDRRDAQKDGQRGDRRDAQKDRQREDRRDTKSGDDRRETRQERAQEPRQGAREQRQEQRQGAQERREPGAAQTEGRSPPGARERDRPSRSKTD